VAPFSSMRIVCLMLPSLYQGRNSLALYDSVKFADLLYETYCLPPRVNDASLHVWNNYYRQYIR